MAVDIKKCTCKNLRRLQRIMYETFYETFKHQNSLTQMNAHLDKTCNLQQLGKEVSNDTSPFFFVTYKQEIVGYVKVNTRDTHSKEMDNESLEIGKLYIKKRFQKYDLGRHLLNKAIEITIEHKKKKVWIGVWEQNKNAIAFYKKMNFVQTGSRSFHIDDEEHKTLILTLYNVRASFVDRFLTA
ncbi:N-acetyltransferase [Bacillus sp. CDB3]|uniref:GNAT family N-acetyltransferase n=1 Tax=Bacillus sp. CDB3 TaxID=360310 RepID=UPI0009D7EFF2|nr:GNAT family N-acetyltransferase [Bacillus sp. CDB3]OQR53380.1 GNAT family N-acetyltransferase [Bacillus sp. CDB3]